MPDFDEQHLDKTFAALSDPTRRAILQQLASGDASVNELAAPFPVSLPAISRHLKVLEEAGLLQRRREGKYRPCQLDGRALVQAANWINIYRQFWGDQFEQLAQFLDETDPEHENSVANQPGGETSNDNKEDGK
jgi:DNA-binding transcriptional ArsR family regulator